MRIYLTLINCFRNITVVAALLVVQSTVVMAHTSKHDGQNPSGDLSQSQELADSTRLALEIFNAAVDVTEQNNAIFPVLMKNGFESEYKALKDSITTQVTLHGMSADEAVGRYIFWFFRYFDRHNQCNSEYFYKEKTNMKNLGLVNYFEIMAPYEPQPIGCKVDDNTYLLRLPSCSGENPTFKWLQEKKEEFLKSKCEYLILDLRGNMGGSDEYSLLFTEMMCDCSAIHDEQFMHMNSPTNTKVLMEGLKENPDTTIERVLKEAASTPAGTLINWSTTAKGSGNYTPMVRKGAIIIDNFCASSGESPIRMVRNYSKSHAIVYGREHTLGADKSGNCNFIKLPNSEIEICYPMTVDMELEQTCKKKKTGHAPDVIIPLPYPEKLTDNIDNWVLWVAEDMKKR